MSCSPNKFPNPINFFPRGFFGPVVQTGSVPAPVLSIFGESLMLSSLYPPHSCHSHRLISQPLRTYPHPMAPLPTVHTRRGRRARRLCPLFQRTSRKWRSTPRGRYWWFHRLHRHLRSNIPLDHHRYLCTIPTSPSHVTLVSASRYKASASSRHMGTSPPLLGDTDLDLGLGPGDGTLTALACNVGLPDCPGTQT